MSSDNSAASLEGTVWEGEDGSVRMRFEFRRGGVLAYQMVEGTLGTDATWKQERDSVYMAMNKGFSERRGTILGNAISGSGWNKAGEKWQWNVIQTASPSSAPSTSTGTGSFHVPGDVRFYQRFIGIAVIVTWLLLPIWLYRLWESWPTSAPDTTHAEMPSHKQDFTLGEVVTCSAATGWKQYNEKKVFHRGERVGVYSEALNVTHAGQIALTYEYKLASPTGDTVLSSSEEVSQSNVLRSSWAQWTYLTLPKSAASGVYTISVRAVDRLTQADSLRTVPFAVVRAGK